MGNVTCYSRNEKNYSDGKEAGKKTKEIGRPEKIPVDNDKRFAREFEKWRKRKYRY